MGQRCGKMKEAGIRNVRELLAKIPTHQNSRKQAAPANLSTLVRKKALVWFIGSNLSQTGNPGIMLQRRQREKTNPGRQEKQRTPE